MKAVIDRIMSNVAVLMVGDEELKVDFPVKLLPKGSKEGSWLKIEIDLDQAGTAKQTEKIEGMLDKLKSKPRG
jgi:hypothetical protein